MMKESGLAHNALDTCPINNGLRLQGPCIAKKGKFLLSIHNRIRFLVPVLFLIPIHADIDDMLLILNVVLCWASPGLILEFDPTFALGSDPDPALLGDGC
ncbi:hypothetical protein EVAR_32236_1 [Eumeta japonica]|uniref:Uncharacterized protein n=1 Tax=Eumeta variegata TaxID=151549 RepID=A0A4C1YNQ3_EUMVA|nr:hypothetical protein EVAR_32236_1 [Eumeta japonica]